MGRKLQYYGSRILRNNSRELDVDSQRDFLEALISDMTQILRMEKGLGLAAPQAGENVRLFILNSQELDLDGHSVFINPRVEISGDMEKDEEGCLSIPGVFEFVRRPRKSNVTALDLDGSEFRLELEGYPARAAQHENDHLNGVLFVDRLSPIRKRLVKKKLAQINREYGTESRIL